MKLTGKAWKYGDNVNTDAIIPGRYLSTTDPKELAKHCLEDLDPTFASQVQTGDIIIAGKNFGCGSSREHAPLCLRAAGVSCVIAETFARIFLRNAINLGLPVLECPEAARAIQAGHRIEVELSTGQITDRDTGQIFQAKPYPEFMLKIIDAGGLVPHTMKQTNAAIGSGT
ncbi:MAG: 3-isopropylmalate dehydratase small subunit [Chloroflexota bacterium]